MIVFLPALIKYIVNKTPPPNFFFKNHQTNKQKHTFEVYRILTNVRSGKKRPNFSIPLRQLNMLF